MAMVKSADHEMLVLRSHPKAVDGARPTASYLEAYTVRDATSHWFWDDGRALHRHNERGQAVVSHRGKSGRLGIFIVARLLLETRYEGLPPRTRVTCGCGLPQCINPSHWRVVFPPPRFRLQPVGDYGWELIVLRHADPLQVGGVLARAATIRASDGPLVHVIDAIPGQPLRARCGRVFVPASAVVVTALPTCEACR
jgi:hypothetical protein